jgi:hypothetical protein
MPIIKFLILKAIKARTTLGSEHGYSLFLSAAEELCVPHALMKSKKNHGVRLQPMTYEFNE